MRCAASLQCQPPSAQITKSLISQYSTVWRSQGIKPSSINRDLTCLSGIFTALKDAELFFGEHPFRGLKRLKEDKPETAYFTQEEIAELLSKVDGDNKKIAILCLSTGARWSEAAKLKAPVVRAYKRPYAGLFFCPSLSSIQAISSAI